MADAHGPGATPGDRCEAFHPSLNDAFSQPAAEMVELLGCAWWVALALNGPSTLGPSLQADHERVRPWDVSVPRAHR